MKKLSKMPKVKSIQRRSLLRAMTACATGATPVIMGCGSGSDSSPLAANSQTTPSSDGAIRSGAVVGTASGATPALVAPASAPPTPATPIAAVPAGQISVTAVSGQSQTNAPFCFGLPVFKGDVPANRVLTCSAPDSQVVVKNRWPDGSVKFAVVAGRTSLTANVPVALGFTVSTVAQSGASLTEADLAATGVTATLSFGAIGSVDLQALIGTASTYNASTGRWSAGRVMQWISGPVMSSWTYYAPVGSDNSLTAWFEVRLWRGGTVEILPWLENGWLRVAGATSKSGQTRLIIGGSLRFDATLDLPHHCRAVVASGSTPSHWLSQDPGVLISHDVAYLQSTKLVPTYFSSANPATVIGRISKTYSPLALADYPAAMGSGGYDGSIGLLPEWDAAYLSCSGNTSALASVIANSYSGGRYPIHYRDEATNRPLRFSAHPNLVVSGSASISSSGSSSRNEYTPTPSGTSPPVFASSHQPSIGYLAYLLTGRYYFCEQIQFQATLNFLKQPDATRRNAEGVIDTASGSNTTRGTAWALRTLAQAACVAPDEDTNLRPELLDSVTKNIQWYFAKYITRSNNPQGVCEPYSDYTANDGVYQHSTWMEDFLTAAWGYMASMELSISADTQNRLLQFFQWKAQSVVGRFGAASPTSYYYAEAAPYTFAAAPSDTADWSTGTGPWYSDWGQIYAATSKTSTATTPELRGGYFPEATSYWGNLQPALAYAVDLGVTGALAGYQRMTGAPNWQQFVNSAGLSPVWGVRPRASLR